MRGLNDPNKTKQHDPMFFPLYPFAIHPSINHLSFSYLCARSVVILHDVFALFVALYFFFSLLITARAWIRGFRDSGTWGNSYEMEFIYSASACH
ncbi:hypothetical protein BO70DRAFT_105436 [Aspergillus heteromorphus CBS 117.55]|uniref:Uncharacterized protein n=1 Tax=Aspergillus heteromorphus CBS 117.55 TaxID=1448321 RepID=A0A317VLD5_9EURO|nr:uncharacterized protein BO70DRAFT_105436 [Aspergillus heteromorphus CBS 117.55]PWY74379.1 hypothetical protein BO70DRAFT_105436 [Aspergillus heteromorphus CBS 117.55]